MIFLGLEPLVSFLNFFLLDFSCTFLTTLLLVLEYSHHNPSHPTVDKADDSGQFLDSELESFRCMLGEGKPFETASDFTLTAFFIHVPV